MSATSLAGRVSRMLDLNLKNMGILVGLSLIVGITEDEMAPFRSVIYIVVLFFIFHASVSDGMRQGIFLASGFLFLLVIGSAFRPSDAMAAFLQELPGDVFLFYSLGFLPGFFIHLYECEVRDLKLELAQKQAKVRALRARTSPEVSNKEAPSANSVKNDLRRANSLAEVIRNLMEAEKVPDILEGVGKAVVSGLDPEVLAVLLPTGGGFQLTTLVPESSQKGTIPADFPAISSAVSAGKPVSLQAGAELVPGLTVNVIAPLVSKGRLVGLVGVKTGEGAPADPDVKYLATVTQIAQALIAKRMK